MKEASSVWRVTSGEDPQHAFTWPPNESIRWGGGEVGGANSAFTFPVKGQTRVEIDHPV